MYFYIYVYIYMNIYICIYMNIYICICMMHVDWKTSKQTNKQAKYTGKITYVPRSKDGIWSIVFHLIMGILTMGI